ncbi:putative polysaccharide biosynthesis protein [Bacillus alkalicellulosilyticus]|uniref:putative polysaccharide biosynthesis protein n=1 Tax=Alkalihalobacterium alkalicellulosilyticum TaxID=1912214 RepID=UPI00148234BD|nr:polysaccharide biosynthesis protein [Bacillus alkalicellulosilyticus]
MSAESEHIRKFWQGALLLSIAALIAKVMSAIYRVPYQNIAGDVGFYVYQQVYPFYGIAFTLSMYGFPVIISRLMSEERQLSNRNHIMGLSFQILFIVFVVTGGLFFLSAGLLATIMGDSKLVVPLQIAALSFLFVPFLSVLRGVFQGEGNMLPTALSHVIEQAIRVVLILLLAYYFVTNGFGAYAAGTGAMIVSVLASFVSILFLFLFFIRKHSIRSFFSISFSKSNWKIARTVIADGVLFSLSALILLSFQLVDSLTILRLLQGSGVYIETAKEAKGIFDRGQPLIQFGTIIATSIALSLVPAIASAMARGMEKAAQIQAELTLRLTVIIGLAASIGLFIIIKPTNRMLFTNDAGSEVLAILSLSIVFSSVVIITAAVLQGYGKIQQSAVHIGVGLLCKIILNIILIPFLDTMGAAVSTVLGLALIAFLNSRLILVSRGAVFTEKRKIYGIIGAVSFMVLVTTFWKEGMELIPIPYELNVRLYDGVIALTSSMVGAICLGFLLLRWQVFSEEELASSSTLVKIAKVIQKRRISNE